MASATQISATEYLSTSYRPDCDLVDGQLIERNMGEFDHSKLQGALVIWFGKHQREWNIHVLPEQRVQVKPNRFRIPDVCVVSRDQPIEPVFTHPPLICIEILSKDDSLRSMQARIDDYLNFGVPNIWILDPETRRAYICDRTGLHAPQTAVLEVPNTPISIPLPGLFAELD
jgi:Uma2 family endonuclease